MMKQTDYISVKDADECVYRFLYTFNKYVRQNKNAIHGGKIANLSLYSLDDKLVAQYDKGWVILPSSNTPEGKAMESIIERWN